MFLQSLKDSDVSKALDAIRQRKNIFDFFLTLTTYIDTLYAIAKVFF